MTTEGISGPLIRLSLLGGFRLDVSIEPASALPREAQHLLALLAVRGRVVSRSTIARTLWPDASEAHAYASLRSALSRMGDLARGSILITNTDLVLKQNVIVDFLEARALAHRLLDPAYALPPNDLTVEAIQTLTSECLPDWYEDWALAESEEWRQLRLHALDALALHLTAAGRFGAATAAALAATRADPLRESACAVLIQVHLAEGNQSEAIRTFDRYRALLRLELGIEPTSRLRMLLPGQTGLR